MTPEAERIRQIIGKWPTDDLRRAFVMGAKWWEYYSAGGTMFSSEVDRAEEEAEKRYPDGKVKEGVGSDG